MVLPIINLDSVKIQIPTSSVFKTVFLLIAIGSISSCYYDNREDLYQNLDNPCDTENVSFASQVEPIMSVNCATSSCHAGSSPSAGLNLEGHQNIADAVLNGRVINRINRTEGESGLMPPSGRLSDCQIDLIQAWASDGAPNN